MLRDINTFAMSAEEAASALSVVCKHAGQYVKADFYAIYPNGACSLEEERAKHDIVTLLGERIMALYEKTEPQRAV